MIDPTTNVRPNDRVVYRSMGDGKGGVVLHLDSAAYYSVNTMGAFIWNLIENGRPFGELIAELKKGVENSPPQLEVDVEEFLNELDRRDLVRFESSI
jgi:Coenzyme PQQ synthesis protein D (PqqD)